MILRAVERALSKHGYHVMIATVGDREDGRSEGLRVVSERRVDGVILAGPDINRLWRYRLSSVACRLCW